MTFLKKPIFTLLLTWLAWAILVIGFQYFAGMRFQPQLPDNVLNWTGDETTPGAHDKQPYLLEPFLNREVAYDSEFYLSIAIAGYDDPGLRAVWQDPNQPPHSIWDQWPDVPFGIPRDFPDGHPPSVPATYVAYSLNYAFFPFYPLVMRAFMLPLSIFGLDPIATGTLAGALVSLLGALAAALALYDLTRDELSENGRLRTAFYLLIFPTGFFLAMVHTEGLFVGLAFGSLALLKRRQWLLAGLLAGCATATRAVGVALVIPFGIAWLQEAAPYARSLLRRGETQAAEMRFPWHLTWQGLAALGPLIGYFIWDRLLGTQFRTVETAFFGRGLFVFQQSIDAWSGAFHDLFGAGRGQLTANPLGWGLIALAALLVLKILIWSWFGNKIPARVSTLAGLALALFAAVLVFQWATHTNNPQRSVYYMGEFAATILALAACAYLLRKQPGIALFSLMVVLISFFSGAAQGMSRYILGAPAVFLMLGQLGEQSEAFDRAWTIASVLLMGLLAMLFGFNFWIA